MTHGNVETESEGASGRGRSARAAKNPLCALASFLPRTVPPPPHAPQARDAFPFAALGRALLAPAKNSHSLGAASRAALRPPLVDPPQSPHEGPQRVDGGGRGVGGGLSPRGAWSRRGDPETQNTIGTYKRLFCAAWQFLFFCSVGATGERLSTVRQFRVCNSSQLA